MEYRQLQVAELLILPKEILLQKESWLLSLIINRFLQKGLQIDNHTMISYRIKKIRDQFHKKASLNQITISINNKMIKDQYHSKASWMQITSFRIPMLKHTKEVSMQI